MKVEQSSAISKYLFPRLQDIIFVAAFYLILLLGTNLIRDGDPGRHITLGKYMIENRTFLTKDLFSYTIYSKPIAVHEWFSEIIYGASYMLMDLNGVILVAALILSITFVLIYRELTEREAPRLLAFGLTIWAIFITMIHWLARPHLLSYISLALFAPLIGKIYRGKEVSLWLIAVVMLFWANSHGGFIYGFATWGAYFVGWIIENRNMVVMWTSPIFKRLLMAGGVSFLVTLINPAGWGLWKISVGYASQKYFSDRISEWQSADFHSPGAWPFLAFVAILLLISLRSNKSLPLGEAFLIIGFTALGIYSVRSIPPFAIAVVPLTGTLFKPYFEKIPILLRINQQIETLEHNLRGIVWPVVVVSLCAILLATGTNLDAAQTGYHFNEKEFPVEAVNWLEENPLPGHMFNFFRWGGYLIYRLWPDQLVFMDGQTEYFGEDLTRQHDQILNALDGWEQAVEEHEITWMIVPTDSRIALLLENTTTWKTLYRDDLTVIFQKQ